MDHDRRCHWRHSALALWLGRGLIIKKDKEGYSVQVEKDRQPDTRTDNIKVAEALEIKDAEAGNIIGRQDAAGDRAQNIDVASHAKLNEPRWAHYRHSTEGPHTN